MYLLKYRALNIDRGIYWRRRNFYLNGLNLDTLSGNGILNPDFAGFFYWDKD